MLLKQHDAAREGETKLLLPAGCLGHSGAEQMTMLTPLTPACRDAWYCCLPHSAPPLTQGQAT